uniref:Preproalbumin PawS1 n=1 Tax=Sabazia liebmannii TaxID=1226250 RepID=A0A023GYH5_9ASTR|nr:preproalbumin PawS1 [Sabazia liebmannii]
MAKLALVVLAMAAIVAFVEVSGYKTTITTITTEDTNGGCYSLPLPPFYFCPGQDNLKKDNGRCYPVPYPPFYTCTPDGLDNRKGSSVQCDRQIPIQQLNHCQMHLTQGQQQQQHLNLCCNELQQVKEQCQCEAIKQMAKQAQRQLQGGQQQMEQMLRKVQMLPNQCNLEVKKCQTGL